MIYHNSLVLMANDFDHVNHFLFRFIKHYQVGDREFKALCWISLE